MRWSDSQISALDKEGQILALNYAQNCISLIEQQQQIVANINQNIEELNKKTAKMRTGVFVYFLPLILVFFMFGGLILVGSKVTFFLMFLVIAGYGTVDTIMCFPIRNQKAELYFKTNYPPLAMAKTSAEANYMSLCNSDEFYNTQLLLPDSYLSPHKIQALIDLLRQRRAHTISDAMVAYEAMEHQRRIETIELEKLRAAQEAANAQKRAARAAESTAKATRKMAEEQKRQNGKMIAALRESQRQEVVQQKQSSRRRSGNVCYKCKMEIPAKAKVCPYCRSGLERSHMETLFGWDEGTSPFL